METIVVIGAGGHASEVCSYVADIAAAGSSVRLLGCVDEYKSPGGHGTLNVIGGLEALDGLFRTHSEHLRCITAVGDNETRRRLVARVEAIVPNCEWWTLRHPLASVGQGSTIGPGSMLAPFTIVTVNTHIGAHCILNVQTSVSHDCEVGDYVNLNPGVKVCGCVTIGTGSFIGAGTTIIDQMKVGEHTIVGAGAAIVRDLPGCVTAVGVPARIVKHRD